MLKKLTIASVFIVGFIFLPTSIFLAIGMMPTIVCYLTDRTVNRAKTISVACMNFAGCFPFLLEFWTEFGAQTVDNALRMASNPETIIVIYVLAAGGYAIDMAITGITTSYIIQRSQKRIKNIKKEQDDLVKRWGEKVTGRYKLDDYGFPVNPIPEKITPSKDNKENDDFDDG